MTPSRTARTAGRLTATAAALLLAAGGVALSAPAANAATATCTNDITAARNAAEAAIPASAHHSFAAAEADDTTGLQAIAQAETDCAPLTTDVAADLDSAQSSLESAGVKNDQGDSNGALQLESSALNSLNAALG
jgi:hypothetical protein